MGFNTTIVIYNDALLDIKEDEDFGSELYEAIMENVGTNKPVDLFAGSRHAGRVIEQHHSSFDVLIRVGGNTGTITNKGKIK